MSMHKLLYSSHVGKWMWSMHTILEGDHPRTVFGLGLGCLTIFQLYRGSQFYWWRKLLYWVHLAWEGFKLITLVEICTDWIGDYDFVSFHPVVLNHTIVKDFQFSTNHKPCCPSWMKGKINIHNFEWIIKVVSQ